MKSFRPSDPAEGSALMRLFYRDWRPTLFGRWVNRFACWWSGLGLPPSFQAALEVRGRILSRVPHRKFACENRLNPCPLCYAKQFFVP